ncbi:hypothetical protein E1B28_008483 [Marasmius oreades]|uniref:Bacteriophage T5 Orf172 DNA-binding domain-containing protein n=1 Tax=Marasmius oreades TaxID=181124 RepID=A0A9P7RZ63_9AGAR|nr:uncharacterized protein E1B28_013847 [Marasmius oreades]XP_043008577.1 uncharacterized protein E1B28_008483 [Marasmius oreades]KAG7085307.1 hypothetical protein E1B28_013847 [Marasmius oreades]KAG7092107.1 hypothetical protein E1B28_008483 [Marasmius oreades]
MVVYRSIASKYLKRRQKGYQREEAGWIYLVKGKWNGEEFLKIGRSINVSRRLKEHKRCKINDWTVLGKWWVPLSHRTEALIHLSMRLLGFRKAGQRCRCGISHRERFVFNARGGERLARSLIYLHL